MRSYAEIERLVEEQERSGESVRGFCTSRGLTEKSFYVWRQRVRKRKERFVPVVVGERIELELASGVRLKVSKHDLKAVLEALQ